MNGYIEEELKKAKAKHPVFADTVEQGMNIITEEYLELARAVNDREQKKKICEEAAHVAVTAERFVDMLCTKKEPPITEKEQMMLHDLTTVLYKGKSDHRIYAIDFDGTICESEWPEIGDPKWNTVLFVRALQDRGDRWILLTMREGRKLEEALWWLRWLGLFPDAVNDNLPERCEQWGNNPRKIYADTYIDDHNAGGLVIPEIG